MYITRTIEPQIIENLYQGKVIIVYGPRQSGKTTLAKHIIAQHEDAKYFLCELPEVNGILQSQSPEMILPLFEGSKLIVLDEAQTVSNIGKTLKILVDTHPEIQIIATGSSSFDLTNEIVEPLAGRKYEYKLLPLSVQEIMSATSRLQVQSELEQYLRFGQYPGIYTSTADRSQQLIQETTASYLFKDILAFQDIRNSEVLLKLLQMLALQIGSEVSYTELAGALKIDQQTVQRYLDLLEKIFVVYRLMPFSRNLRNELNKKRKVYFYDLGIRNALIRNFNSLDIRSDVDAIWENFCINERMKYLQNNQLFANHYFWRTWEGQEIDYIEEKGGRLHGYEFKWNKSIDSVKTPQLWLDTYQNADFSVINKDNLWGFIS